MMEITDRILFRMLRHGLISSPGDWTIQPASGGLNSRVFFVRRRGRLQVFTVRVSHPDREWVLAREAHALEQVAQHCQCAPALAGLIQPADEDTGTLLIHAFAPGGPAPLDAATRGQLSALATCLANLHRPRTEHYEIWPALTAQSGSRAEAFRTRLTAVERYATFSSGAGSDLHTRIQQVYRRLQHVALAGHGWGDASFAQLHGDLSAGNIIWNDDAVILIDWEYSRRGDPAEDLAYLFAEQPVSEQEHAAFFERYVNAGGDRSDFSRAATYTALVALDSVLWWGDYALQRDAIPAASKEVNFHLSRAESSSI